MCNLYYAIKSVAEVAALLRAQLPLPFNTPGDVLPGMPGIVVRDLRGAVRNGSKGTFHYWAPRPSGLPADGRREVRISING